MPTLIPALPFRHCAAPLVKRGHNLKGTIIIFATCLCFSHHGHTDTRPQRLIKEASGEFLENKAVEIAKSLDASHYKVVTTPLDKNMRLPLCKTPMHIQDLSQAKYGNQLLRIHCKNHWDVLVSGMIHIYVAVLVSKKTLTKNHKISESDIDWQEMDITQLPNGFLTRPEDAIDKYPQTGIKAGTPLHREQLSNSHKISSTPP